MGRYARQTITDVPYHVINRGNNHQPIFFSDDDYWFFLESLSYAKEKYPCRIYSFVFMTNHVHLLLEPLIDNRNLACFMKYISQRHGQYINKRYKRSGTLWEGRFKSSPVSSDRYLLSCSRYIEMNPVRAGIVERPGDYVFIPQAEWDLIREAVQRNWAYGNTRFKEQMEQALDRKFELKQAGRKPKM